MSLYDGATITVLNWEKYNPRKTTSRPTWFRFENNIATGPAFFGLDAEQKWLWVVILSMVSQKNGEPIIWNSQYIKAITGISERKQDETIEIYEKFVRLHASRAETLRDVHKSVPDAYPTDGRTDEHNGSSVDDPRETFEEIYKSYPRRSGSQRKADGIKACVRKLTTPELVESFRLAVKNYSAHCVSEKKVGTNYVLQFATFVNGVWEEWIAPQTHAKAHSVVVRRAEDLP